MTKEQEKQMRKLLEKQTDSMTDEEILNYPNFVEKWKSGKAYSVGKRLEHNGTIYKVLQDHTSQDDWAPDLATSLFSRIDEEHSGTKEDPIPYYVNMEVFSEKYYTEDSVLYKCVRDSGIALQNKAADLVNNYFEVVE